MLFALLLAASLTDWVPARWTTNDVKSLELLDATAVNCLLLEKAQWNEGFAQEAAKRGVATLGVIRPGSDALESARKSSSLHFNGVVMEGIFDPSVADRVRRTLADSKIELIEMSTRSRMRFDAGAPVVGTFQGLWPGIRIEDDKGATHAGPSSGPWINTNTGFLRFARAATDATVWIGYVPPSDQVVSIERYLQAIGDAAMTGARWVVALDPDFNKRLLARDASALKGWKRITQQQKFYEDHKEWRSLKAHSELALVEDAGSGALLSGGVLDMIAVKHTPVRPIPYAKISPDSLDRIKMAVDVDPSALSQTQLAVLKAFTRAGGTLLSGPPNWKFQTLTGDAITLEKADLDKLDEIWKELNSLTGRKNMGARLFNVSSMLSNLVETADHREVILHLVNYADYPAENLTAHVLGVYKKARIYRPEGPVQDLELYAVDEGTALDIDKVGTVATIILEP